MVTMVNSLKEELHRQAKIEQEAFLLYESASQWFELRHLTGIAKKLRAESNSELGHFRAILDYLTLREQPVVIPQAEYTQEWTTELQVFEFFFELEKKNNESITAVYKKARENEDYDLERFVGTLLQPQVESVNEWEELVEKMKSFTALPGLIWHLDAIIK